MKKIENLGKTMGKNKGHSDEHKKSNQKTVTIDGEEKLLLMDDEETSENEETISERELFEAIQAIVEKVLEGILVRKSLYEGWLGEAEYPEGFSVEKFKSLTSFKKRVEYAREHLGRLGAGSARIVFAVDPNTVVKIALNKKGQAQNEIEVDASNIGYENIANVENYDDEDYLYIEMERAKKLKKSDWKKLTGWHFDAWMNTLTNYIIERGPKKTNFKLVVPEDFEDIEESELFNNIVVMITDFDMPAGDITRTSSWGIVERNSEEMPVLVDYGLTGNIFTTHYRR